MHVTNSNLTFLHSFVCLNVLGFNKTFTRHLPSCPSCVCTFSTVMYQLAFLLLRPLIEYVQYTSLNLCRTASIICLCHNKLRVHMSSATVFILRVFFFADYMNCPSRVVCCKSSNWRLVKLQQHVRLARHLDGEWSFFNSSMQSTLGSHYLTNARIHLSVAVTSPLKMQPLTLLVIILEYFLIVCMLLQIVPVQENKVRMTAS